MKASSKFSIIAGICVGLMAVVAVLLNNPNAWVSITVSTAFWIGMILLTAGMTFVFAALYYMSKEDREEDAVNAARGRPPNIMRRGKWEAVRV